MTPPLAIVVLAISLFNSSSFLTANWICLGIILVFLFSLAAFPANSKTSAAKYSKTAARYTGAPAPTLSEYFPVLRYLAILPTGNWSPAWLILIEFYLRFFLFLLFLFLAFYLNFIKIWIHYIGIFSFSCSVLSN